MCGRLTYMITISPSDIFTASPRVSRALVMALAAHGSQVRMGTSLPYIVHPVGVALAVAARGGTEDEVIAALLHDSVEDTTLTLKQIRRAFGDNVADLVDAVTKKEGLSKMEQVQRIASLGLMPVQLKLADTRHNMKDLDPEGTLYAFYERSLVVLETAEAIYLAAEAA